MRIHEPAEVGSTAQAPGLPVLSRCASTSGHAVANSPKPSEWKLFGLPLRLIGIAFFLGRFPSYAAWAQLRRLASLHLDLESHFERQYLGGYSLLTQQILLALLYGLTKTDWRMLLEENRFVWRRASR
jgi:hypothetical protein